MDFDRLRYFCVIAETGSMRRAAEILRLSSPALSKAMRLLEKECGHQLVLASGRGIAITDQGKVFANRARAILRDVQTLREDTLAKSETARPLRLGSFEVFTTYFLGPLVKTHLEGSPLIVHELVAGHLERALIEREVDLGITYVPVPSPEIEHQEITQIEMGIYARKDAFPEMELRKVPFAVPVTPLTGSPDRIRGLDGWPDESLSRNIRYQVTLMETALEFCRQGLAAAYLPRFVARLHNERCKEAYQLVRLDTGKPSGNPPRLARRGRQPVYLLRRKSDLETRTYKSIARALRSICRADL